MATRKTPAGTTSRSSGPLSRRELLQRSAALGISSSALAATPATIAGQTPSPSAATPAATGAITIADTGANLPADPVTLRWLDLGASPRATFLQAFFPPYEEAHPNITVQYEQAPGLQRNELIPLGVQSGDAPDVFLAPTTVTPGQMVSEGWVRPLDDIIPNFEEWKQRFPPGTLVEGITVFNGKVYGCPFSSNRFHGSLLLYNVDYMQEAGYDPSETPLTLDGFRDAARKITEQGQGEYYGFILGGSLPGRWREITAVTASLAGAPTAPFGNYFGYMNWQTGEFSYTSDEFIAAVELWLALRDDGSVFPGFLDLTGGESRGRFSTQGAAGMTLQGPWNIPLWNENVPNFNYGVASPPIQDPASAGKVAHPPGAALPFWLYAETQVPEVAGDVFANITNRQNQQALLELNQGGGNPIHVDVQPGEEASEQARQADQIFDQQMRVGPAPVVRNPDVELVYAELRPVTPSFGETIIGLYTGQLDDVGQAMQQVQDLSDQELERAIEAARENGANVSRDDFVFPNWDPQQDYTEEDYAAL